MRSPQQQLIKARKNLVLILQLATRADLTPDELLFLKGWVRSFELAVAAKERKIVQVQKSTTDGVI